ncbi:hypothetical protein QR680_001420 [Steinernema hermaphroditum]|uniref:Uncharacterized protein n=1 Tax=Steinernema hermaphroditum TaxID=289476 RepID=A0AA39GZ40_9BILA|nr:hypothetical protein QR680_001420 [Steinernema hermaphroditum]
METEVVQTEHGVRPRRTSVSSVCFHQDTVLVSIDARDFSCEPEIQVSLENLPQIPSRYNVNIPWNRPHVRVYSSNTLRYNWNWMKALPVRGLSLTVGDIIRYLDDNDCLFLPSGGTVRDALIGEGPLDIGGEISCDILKVCAIASFLISRGQVHRLCIEKYGPALCRIDEKEHLTVGSPTASNRLHSVIADALTILPWSTNSTHWDFTANSLAVYDDQVGNVFLIDLTGQGKDDACKRKLFVVNEPDWDDLRSDDFLNVMRSYEMRLKGFSCGDERVCRLLVEHIRRLFSFEKLEDFYCHFILDGVGRRNGRKYVCHVEKRSERTELHRQKFGKMLTEDFGSEFYEKVLLLVEQKMEVLPFDKTTSDNESLLNEETPRADSS